jgi:hypothetical protein
MATTDPRRTEGTPEDREAPWWLPVFLAAGLGMLIIGVVVTVVAARSIDAVREAERRDIQRIDLAQVARCTGGRQVLNGFNTHFARPLRAFLLDAARAREETARQGEVKLRKVNRRTARRYRSYRRRAVGFELPECPIPASLEQNPRLYAAAQLMRERAGIDVDRRSDP